MRAFLLLCLSLSFYFLAAQTLISSKYVGWSGSDMMLQTIHDKSGDLHACILEKSDSFKLILYNRAFTEVHEYSIFRMPNEQLVAGFIKEDKIYFFCNHQLPTGYDNYTIDISSGKIDHALVLSDKRKEKLIDRISSGDYALWLGIDKKNSSFVIYNWRNQHDMDTIIYQFNDPSTWVSLTKSEVFYRDVDVAKIDEAGLPDIQSVSARNKVYLVHDTIFLTMNRNLGNTIVYAFDLYHKTVSYRLIGIESPKIKYSQLSGKNVPDEDYVDNSYLLNGRLYFVSATDESLHVVINDFYSNDRLNFFEAKREDTIDFKNTPVLQEGKALYFNNTKELSKTRQLLRKMTSGNAAIAAIRDSTGIAMTLGSNKEESQMSAPSFSSYSGPAASIMTPGDGMGGFSSGTWTKAVRFRMLIDSSRFQHISGAMETSINDRIDDFKKNIKIPEHMENLLFQDGRYIYIYYDKKKKSLVLQHFPV